MTDIYAVSCHLSEFFGAISSPSMFKHYNKYILKSAHLRGVTSATYNSWQWKQGLFYVTGGLGRATRLCAARTRLFRIITTKNRALYAPCRPPIRPPPPTAHFHLYSNFAKNPSLVKIRKQKIQRYTGTERVYKLTLMLIGRYSSDLNCIRYMDQHTFKTWLFGSIFQPFTSLSSASASW